MLKGRITKLETIYKAKYTQFVPPKRVIEENGIYTTETGELLTRDGDKYLFEDGSVFYDDNTVPKDQVGLICITYA